MNLASLEPVLLETDMKQVVTAVLMGYEEKRRFSFYRLHSTGTSHDLHCAPETQVKGEVTCPGPHSTRVQNQYFAELLPLCSRSLHF